MTGRVYPTIGVDPGQRWIGIAARIDNRCLDAATLDRGPVPTPVEERYLGPEQARHATRLLDTIHTMMVRHLAAAEAAAAAWDTPPVDVPWRVAVEGIVITRPYAAYHRTYTNDTARQIAQLRTLPEVALLVGAVLGHYPGAVVVRPQRFGDRRNFKHGDVLSRLGPYPPELKGRWPEAFIGGDKGRERVHEQAAWAVAGAAQLTRPLRLRAGRMAG